MGLDIRINDGELRTAVSSLLRIDAALSEMPRLTDDTANAVGDATLARAVKEFTDSWRVKREDIITMVRAHRTALEAILKWSDAVDSIGGRSPGGVLGEAVSRSVEEARRRIEQNLGGSGQEDLDGIEQIPVTPLERPSKVPPMVPPLHDLGSFHTLPMPVTRPTGSSASGQGPALVAPDVDATLQAVGTAPTARPAQVGTGAPVASLEDVDDAAPATVNTIGQTTAAASLDGTSTAGAVPVSTISGTAPPAALDGTTTAEPATVSTIDGGGATAHLETASGAEGAPVTAVSGAAATASLDETPTAEPATVSTIDGTAPPAALDGTTPSNPRPWAPSRRLRPRAARPWSRPRRRTTGLSPRGCAGSSRRPRPSTWTRWRRTPMSCGWPPCSAAAPSPPWPASPPTPLPRWPRSTSRPPFRSPG